MELEREWAQMREMEALLRGGRTDADDERDAHRAEANWLLHNYVGHRLGIRNMPWTDYLHRRVDVFETIADHECTSSTCSQSVAPKGVRFIDPVAGQSYTSSGNVYVCCTTGATHVCTPHECTLEIESRHDHGTTLCPVSGRFKSAVLSQQESFRERQARMTDPAPATYKRATRERKTDRKRARGDNGEPPVANTKKREEDATLICKRLVVANPIYAQMEARVEAASNSLLNTVLQAKRTGRAGTMRGLVSTVVAHYEAQLLSQVLRMRAMGTQPLPDTMLPGIVEYLVRCTCALFEIVHSSHAGKDINMTKLCVPLLYVLMRGMVGMVETCRTTWKITDRRVMYDTGVLDEEHSNSSGLVLRQWVFVPAHPWLGRLLPPDEPTVVGVAGWETELANPMQRMRSISDAFILAMGTGTNDVSRYFLATHVDRLRTDIDAEIAAHIHPHGPPAAGRCGAP